MNEKIKTDTVKKILAMLQDGAKMGTTLDIQKKFLTQFDILGNSKQHKLDKTYLRLAQVWATNSSAIRRKVGSLIVKNNMIISDGYNGTINGFDNVCEDSDGNTKRSVVHAELNAITKLASSTASCAGATVYVTLSPCVDCAKMMIQAGISRVVFGEFYKDIEGLDWLVRKEIPLTFIDVTKIDWNDVIKQEPWQNVFGWNKLTD